MVFIKFLIWDTDNLNHISKHHLTPDEVSEACQHQLTVIESYRHRLLITGNTKLGKQLAIVLSPEDDGGQQYQKGTYYVITAYPKEAYEK
jgi:hypothetical protein